MAGISPPQRYPSGRLKRSVAREIAEQQRARALAATAQAASQPHRQGNSSVMAGSELGRFILREVTAERCVLDGASIEEYQREVYDACERYALAKWQWNRAKGIPQPADCRWDIGPGADDQTIEDKLRRWSGTISAAEQALKCAGMPAFRAARDLILYDTPPPGSLGEPVRRAMQSVHISLYGIDKS